MVVLLSSNSSSVSASNDARSRMPCCASSMILVANSRVAWLSLPRTRRPVPMSYLLVFAARVTTR